jgi:hypothetical protein
MRAVALSAAFVLGLGILGWFLGLRERCTSGAPRQALKVMGAVYF